MAAAGNENGRVADFNAASRATGQTVAMIGYHNERAVSGRTMLTAPGGAAFGRRKRRHADADLPAQAAERGLHKHRQSGESCCEMGRPRPHGLPL